MALTIFPETGDDVTEEALTAIFKILQGHDYVVSGFSVSDGGGLSASIAAGEASIAGYRVEHDAVNAEVLTDDTTNYVYLNADGTFTVNTTGSQPDESVYLAEVVTGSGSVSTITDHRETNGTIRSLDGTYSGSSARLFHDGTEAKWIEEIYVEKSADESRPSDTTIADDSELAFTLPAGGRVLVEFVIHHSGSTNADIQFNLSFEGEVTFTLALLGVDGNELETLIRNTAASDNTSTQRDDTDSDGDAIVIRGMIEEQSGADQTVTYRWAQESSSTTATVVKQGSYIHGRRLS